MRRILAVMATIAAVASACGSGSGSSGPKSNYELGFTTDLSASSAYLGQSLKYGFQGYIQALNSKGGVNGHKIDVTYLDDALQNDRGVANFQQLTTQGKPLAISGEVQSNVCNAMSPLANERKIPLVCFSAGVDQEHTKYTFAVLINAAFTVQPVVDLAREITKLSKPKIGVVNLALATSSAYGDAVVTYAKSQGSETVRAQIDVTNPDPTAQLAQLIAQKPDVITLSTVDLQATKLVQAMKNAGASIPIINTGGGVSLTSLTSFKSPTFYVVLPWSYVNPTLPSDTPKGVKDYAAAVKDVGGQVNGNYTVAGYLQAALLVAAINKCGDACTAAKVRDNLETVQVSSNGLAPQDMVGYTPTQHLPMNTIGAYVWDDTTQFMKLAKTGIKVTIP